MDDRSIREIIREEWKKLSGLTWGERFGYIWDYYKPLMVAILVIILIISIGVSIWHNLQIDRVLQVYFVDCNALEVNGEEIAAEFGEYIGGLGSDQEITIDTSLTLDEEDVSQYSMSSQMKLVAVTAAGDADVVLFNSAGYEKYKEAGGMLDLRTVLSEEQLEEWQDLLVYGTDAETGEETVYALRLDDSPVLQQYNAYYEDEVYGCIMVNSERQETAAEFLQYLLEE